MKSFILPSLNNRHFLQASGGREGGCGKKMNKSSSWSKWKCENARFENMQRSEWGCPDWGGILVGGGNNNIVYINVHRHLMIIGSWKIFAKLGAKSEMSSQCANVENPLENVAEGELRSCSLAVRYERAAGRRK